MTVLQGEDFHLPVEVDIHRPCEVKIALVIERMQAGYGWETIVLSKELGQVGTEPGRYHIELRVLRLPPEPGEYQVSVQLAASDPDLPGRRIGLDSYGWLSGNGITLQVAGDEGVQYRLPTSWEVEAG